jgi:Flp pilus assembly protein TadD
MDLFAQAVDHHQAGHLEAAERIYRQLLRDEPRHVFALHALGLLCHQSGRSDAAVDLISQAIACMTRSRIFITIWGASCRPRASWKRRHRPTRAL